jgi:hypothetical protein
VKSQGSEGKSVGKNYELQTKIKVALATPGTEDQAFENYELSTKIKVAFTIPGRAAST